MSALKAIPCWIASILVVLLPLAYGRNWVGLDGDPGRHIRVGEAILEHGMLHRDVFSFTASGNAFVPYEWLAEVLDAWTVRLSGLPGLVVLTGCVLAIAYGLTAEAIRRRDPDPVRICVGTAAAMLLGVVHWHARPHVFTFVGAASLMLLIGSDRHVVAPAELWPGWATIGTTASLFVAWANLHGGFLYGQIVLATVAVGEVAEAAVCRETRRESMRRAARYGILLVVAGLASLCNPSGLNLTKHVIAFLSDRVLVNHTQEYRSPDFHQTLNQYVALIIVVAIAVLATVRPRIRLAELALVLLHLGLALYSVRNIPLLGIVVIPVVAGAAGSYRRPDEGTPASRLVLRQSWRWTLALPVVAGAVMFSVARATWRDEPIGVPLSTMTGSLPTQFSTDRFPVTAVEQARLARLDGRLFHEFVWGGYILYAWPGQRVFIDGQTDFYGAALAREHAEIVALLPRWRERLEAWGIDVALLATASPLADALRREPGWSLLYCDHTATLLSRRMLVDRLGETDMDSASAVACTQPTVSAALLLSQLLHQVDHTAL